MSVTSLALESAIRAAKDSYVNVPQGEELIEKIQAKFQSLYDKVPISMIEELVNIELSEDDCRLFMFKPTEQHVSIYVKLLRKLQNCDSGKHQNFKSSLLTLIYLVHRKNWAFLETLILLGGLQLFSSMLMESNLYLRGQIFETFLTMIDCDTFDWFQPAANEHSLRLHAGLLELNRNGEFFANLFANRTNTFPNGSMLALQILGFYLSWVRSLYVSKSVLEIIPDNNKLQENQPRKVMRVHKIILDELEQWLTTVTSSVDAAKASAPKDSDNEPTPLDYELKLIKTIFDDFSSTCVAIEIPDESSLVYDVEWIVIAATPNTIEPSDSDAKSESKAVFPDSMDSLKKLKEFGNSETEENKLTSALETYEKALSMSQRLRSHNDDPVIRRELDEYDSQLHYNIATIYWKQATQRKEKFACTQAQPSASESAEAQAAWIRDPDVQDLLRRCEENCEDALSIDRVHAKAIYRLSNVLFLRGRLSEATALLKKYLAETESEGDSKVRQTIQNFMYKCIAGQMLRDNENHLGNEEQPQTEADASTAASALSADTLKVLDALKRRKMRESSRVTHAFIVSEDGKDDNTCPSVDEHNEAISGHDDSRHGDEDFNLIDSVNQMNISTQKKAKAKATKSKKQSESEAEKKQFVKTTKICNELLQKLRKLCQECEKTKDTAANASLLSNMEKLFDDIKDSGVSLKDVIRSSLDESIICGVFLFIKAHSESRVSVPLYRELVACERFDTTLEFAKLGNEDLIQSVTSAMAC